jgi:N-acetylated-alpha-linked acidic dipeptidase
MVNGNRAHCECTKTRSAHSSPDIVFAAVASDGHDGSIRSLHEPRARTHAFGFSTTPLYAIEPHQHWSGIMKHLAPLAILITLGAPGAPRAEIPGFVDPAAQQSLESKLDALISAADQDAWMRRLASDPHHVGSAKTQDNVAFLAEQFRSWGYAVRVDEYEILFPTPRLRSVELVAPERHTALLEEAVLPEDPSTARDRELLPPYHAFSTDGKAEADVVFVNYGIPEDYEILARHGVDVSGKIVIARYGKSWRGIKPKLAAEHGAIAALVYSDPADDGFARGDTYPSGPFKHQSGVQRGSVMDMPLYPGDVLTPFEPAIPGTERLPREKVATITRIPVLPLSWEDAAPILANLGGPVVPPEWRGALPFTYHIGPGPARVSMEVAFNWDRVTARNVIATLEGSTWPDEWVVRGNHHDGWNHGAADPISGLVALMSEARAVGALAAEGSPPRRSIVYAAWDAEEPGLIGSTEWVEHHREQLDRNAVIYINSDGNSRGFLRAGGSHALERMVNDVMDDVLDPQTGVSLRARSEALIKTTGSREARERLQREGRIAMYALGSGSDYTPFFQHLAIPSLNIGFGGEGADGSYHTRYDTYEHFTRFRDPGLAYGAALAKVGGRLTLRMANADRLPFDFTTLADRIDQYIGELEQMADSMREETRRQNALIDEGAWMLALDPAKALGPPAKQSPVPFLNFAPLKNAAAELREAAIALNAQIDGRAVPERINRALFLAERQLTISDGLPERPWYRHSIYAPGFYTGYGVKTLPAVRESLEARQFERLAGHVEATAVAIAALAAHLADASDGSGD